MGQPQIHAAAEGDMAEPGWYNAAGDPPGTQRYWDGGQWLGDAVYEPTAAQPMVPPAPPGGYPYAGGPVVAASTFPSGLKTIAIVLSVLKAIPLAFGVLGIIIVAAAANDLNDEFGDVGFGLDGLLGAAVAILVVIVIVGALLLGFQFVGAIKERPMMVFIPALIMTLFDGLASLGSWLSWNEARDSPFLNEGPGGAILMTTVLAAQAYVAVQAIRANNK